MVYCPKCGTNNKDDAKFCIQCGAALYAVERRERRGEETCFGAREEQFEKECFGLPHGGAIVGVIFGVFIILLGLTIALGIDVGRWIGPFILIVIGILIVSGAIYGLIRYKHR
ncbi:MAG: zinc ribbon domain-containing protein [Candidatus Bathyarchaeia archaeon]